MLILDDIILASVVVLFLILASILADGIICFALLMLGISYMENSDKLTEGGGVKKLKNSPKKSIKQLSKSIKQIEKVGKDIETMIKIYTNDKKTFNIIDMLYNKYGIEEASSSEKSRHESFIKQAKDIYKKEKADSLIFDIDLDKGLSYQNSEFSNNPIDMNTADIKKLFISRLLTDNYPITKASAINNWNIKEIEYTPSNNEEYKQFIQKMFEYTVISSIRNLSDTETSELKTLINKFQNGELTQPQMKLNFFDKTSQYISNCSSYQIRRPFSDKYKKLHWGQRKLLLTEIDFFNRVAMDIGCDKFKKENISLVYPGAAHGHHLLIEMELYPNLIMYLWDPARYNEILYIADFMRRGLDIPRQYDRHVEMAKKYKGRVFINMELSNDQYLEYWMNATTNNIPNNYKTEYGFFTKKSADYFLKYKKGKSDNGPVLFVSDIRLFTNQDAINCLMYNSFKGVSNTIAIKIISEKMRHEDYVRDMQLQRDWFEFVNADYGLFKFKLKTKKFTSNQDVRYKYLDGDIIFQAWAPIASTETRLFTKANAKEAYYNIKLYTDKLKTFNIIMRPHDSSNVLLKSLGLEISDSGVTINNIWTHTLPSNLMGQDTILETFILYDYLKIYKKEVSSSDLILMISDITQSCLDPFNQNDILEYLKDSTSKLDQILDRRRKYHDTFSKRLDYNSSIGDKSICSIKRPNEFKNNYHRR